MLHIVNAATHFCAETLSHTQWAKELWRSPQAMWTHVYVRPADFLSLEQGSPYVSRQMREKLDDEGVQHMEAPVENPGNISIAEIYHAPLRTAFNRMCTDRTNTTTDSQCLRMLEFGIKSTVGPEGLCTILLVFGVIPRPAKLTPSTTEIQRAPTIET